MTPALPLTSPDDQRVTFVELFFDLVFVFSVTQVVHLMPGHVDLPTAGGALLVFWLVWWAWTQFTWALNAANTDHPRIRMVTLVATAIAFFLAIGIPRALGDAALWFALPYIAVRLVGLLAYHWVALSDPMQRRAVQTFGRLSLTGLVAVLAGALLGGAALYWCWGLAIALDLLAAGVGGQLEGWNLHPEHFVERHGLIVIIALGETLIVAATGVAGAQRTPALVATGVLAVGVTCGLWWSYFAWVREALEHALRGREGNARSRMARDAFSVFHFPMLCGVVGLAVAFEEALAHPETPLTAGVRWALGAGLLLFVGGTAGALRRAGGVPLWARWVLTTAGAATIVAIGTEPWEALGISFVVLAAVGVAERRREPPHAPGVPDRPPVAPLPEGSGPA